jgi:hypothetical protein
MGTTFAKVVNADPLVISDTARFFDRSEQSRLDHREDGSTTGRGDLSKISLSIRMDTYNSQIVDPSKRTCPNVINRITCARDCSHIL